VGAPNPSTVDSMYLNSLSSIPPLFFTLFTVLLLLISPAVVFTCSTEKVLFGYQGWFSKGIEGIIYCIPAKEGSIGLEIGARDDMVVEMVADEAAPTVQSTTRAVIASRIFIFKHK
jgi:hypothetical protein